MMTTLLHEYARYNLWANTLFVERLRNAPDHVLDTEVPSSFPTLRATLLHIRDAENAWSCRLQGATVPWPANDRSDITDLIPHSKVLCDLILGYDEGLLLETREFKRLKGDPQRSTVWRMVHHCFNHSTQHRGQLITMMRALGLDGIPGNDLVLYQRSMSA